MEVWKYVVGFHICVLDGESSLSEWVVNVAQQKHVKIHDTGCYDIYQDRRMQKTDIKMSTANDSLGEPNMTQ